MNKEIPFIIHGSKDSIDRDVIYLFDKLPSTRECYEFCNSNKDENRNIIVVKNGMVFNCFKGTPDAINNQILDTYSNHKQKYDNPIKFRVERNIPLKVVRSVRQILGNCTIS